MMLPTGRCTSAFVAVSHRPEVQSNAPYAAAATIGADGSVTRSPVAAEVGDAGDAGAAPVVAGATTVVGGLAGGAPVAVGVGGGRSTAPVKEETGAATVVTATAVFPVVAGAAGVIVARVVTDVPVAVESESWSDTIDAATRPVPSIPTPTMPTTRRRRTYTARAGLRPAGTVIEATTTTG
jgi:hypothetical protein